MLINIKDPKYIATLKDCSLDQGSPHPGYAYEGPGYGINFDKVKDEYFNIIYPENLKNRPELQIKGRSADSLIIEDEDLYFIEFKNCLPKKQKDMLSIKLYDSIAIYSDLVEGVDSKYIREHVHYILVFNPAHAESKDNRVIARREVLKSISKISKVKIFQFIDKKFRNFFVKEAIELRPEEFEDLVKEKKW